MQRSAHDAAVWGLATETEAMARQHNVPIEIAVAWCLIQQPEHLTAPEFEQFTAQFTKEKRS
jgi:hypothetical protein